MAERLVAEKKTAQGGLPPAFVVAVRVVLATSVLLMVWGLVEQYEAPKIWVVRAIGIGAFLALPFAYRLGALRTPLDLAVLAGVAVEILTTLTSVSRRVSIFGEPLQREGLITSLGLAGIYFAARAAHPAGRGLKTTLAWFWVPAGVCAIYALVQAAGWDPVVYGRVALYGAGQVRPFGTLGHANLLGVAMAAASCLALGEALRDRERRPLMRVMAGLFVASLALTLSRGAWIGAGAGLIVTAGLAAAARTPTAWSRRDLAIAVTVLAAIVTGLYAVGWFGMFTQRAAEGAAGAGSAGARIEIWRAALAAFRANPLVGNGPDTFDMIYSRFQTPAYWLKEWATRPFHAHSIYLHQLATRGILGGLAGLALMGATWRAAQRLLKPDPKARDTARAEAREMAPAVCGMLAALAVSGAFGALGITGAVLAAVCAAWLVSAEARTPEPSPAAARRSAIVLAGVAVLVMAAAFVDLRVSHDLARAKALARIDPRKATEYAEKAMASWSFEDGPPRMLSETVLSVAMHEESMELMDRAEWAARQAIARVPARPLNYQRLAEVMSVRSVTGDQEAVPIMRRAYREVFLVSPHDPIIRVEAARTELGMQNYRGGIQMGLEATRIDPTFAPGWLAIARGLEGLDQVDSALVVLDRAIGANWHDEPERRDYALGMRQKLLEERASGTP